MHQRHFLGHLKDFENYTDLLETELYEKGPFQLEKGCSEALHLISYYKDILKQLQLKLAVIQHDAKFFRVKIPHLEKLASIEEVCIFHCIKKQTVLTFK